MMHSYRMPKHTLACAGFPLKLDPEGGVARPKMQVTPLALDLLHGFPHILSLARTVTSDSVPLPTSFQGAFVLDP